MAGILDIYLRTILGINVSFHTEMSIIIICSNQKRITYFVILSLKLWHSNFHVYLFAGTNRKLMTNSTSSTITSKVGHLFFLKNRVRVTRSIDFSTNIYWILFCSITRTMEITIQNWRASLVVKTLQLVHHHNVQKLHHHATKML